MDELEVPRTSAPSTEPSRPPSVTPDTLQLHTPEISGPRHAFVSANVDRDAGSSVAGAGQETPSPPTTVNVQGVRVGGLPVLVETVWSVELPPQRAEFSVDVELSNGLTIVVPHPRRHPDGHWFVVAKDAIGDGGKHGRQLIARFTRHDVASKAQALLSLLGSPFATDGSSMLVLLLAALVASGPGDTKQSRTRQLQARSNGALGGVGAAAEQETFALLSTMVYDLALSDLALRYALLAMLAFALLGRLAARLTDLYPPRSGYTLVIQPREGATAELLAQGGRPVIGRAAGDDAESLMLGMVKAFKIAMVSPVSPMASAYSAASAHYEHSASPDPGNASHPPSLTDSPMRSSYEGSGSNGNRILS